MKTCKQLLVIAKNQLGNNGSKYRNYVHAGGSWCDMFVFWLYDANGNGSLLPWKGQQRTYCPASIKWCAKNLAQIPVYLSMPCDIIYFDWENNGTPNHIGIVMEKISSNSVKTIEGNTSGGKVDDKTRAGKYIQAVYRPKFVPTGLKKKKLSSSSDFEYQSVYMLQVALGMTPTGILDKQTVMKLQAKAGAGQDGAWGPKTSRQIQSRLLGFKGKNVDGEWGPASTVAFKKWINGVCFPESKPAAKPAEKPAAETRKKMSKIGHARKDYDHKAGDSTGKEVVKSSYTYSTSPNSVYNWTYVFRPKSVEKANKAAAMCEKAIANNAIGYSSHGETAYGKSKAMTKLAKAVGYDLGKIKTKCGLSCGDLICLCNRWAGLSTCYIGSGKQLAESLKKNSNFATIKYKKGMQLYRGDVLITAHSNGKNNHVVMAL